MEAAMAKMRAMQVASGRRPNWIQQVTAPEAV
jgi:hypothetical protein